MIKTIMDRVKQLWEDYKEGGIKWQLQVVKFGMDYPDRLISDDKLWEEFIDYSKQLGLYNFKVDKNIDRLTAVEIVKNSYSLVISGKYKY